MKKYFTYKKASNILTVVLIFSFCLLVAAAYLPVDSIWHDITMVVAVILLFCSLLVMMIWFKCPACGSHFIRRAFSREKCKDCGYAWGDDFELGKKVVYKKKKK